MKTIKSSQDIDFIFKNGKSYSLPFLIYVLYNDQTNKIKGDICYIAGKKNGNAVWRNKSKRRLRELCRYIKLNDNFKILVIAKKDILNWDFKLMKDKFVLSYEKNL